jgi:uncharacterized membrane protein
MPDYQYYNTIAVTFAEDRDAYQALTQLKELDSQRRVEIQEAVIVARSDEGYVTEKDRVGSTSLDATAGGGLLGLLLGIIAGPFGMLIGGTTGLLVGSLFDIDDAEGADSALATIAGSVKVGHTSLLAIVGEQSPDVVDNAMSGLGGTVVRRPVADVEAEIAAADAAERQAKREAQKQLVEARRDQSRAVVDAKLAELRAKLPVGAAAGER